MSLAERRAPRRRRASGARGRTSSRHVHALGAMTGIRVISQPLGGSPLARAAEVGSASAAWYAPRPRSAAEWRAHVEQIRRAGGGRDWYAELAPAFAAGGAAAARLARSAGDRGIVVTTGQQPGLFGGPIYTWSKALSALALADALEESTGIPVAPVFWAATDDSDFAEASVTYVAVTGGYEELVLPRPRVPEGASMRDVPLGDVSPLLRRLERGAGSAVYPRALEELRAAYEPNATVGSAYLSLLRCILQPLGIAVLDAAHPAVRGAARPLLVRALGEGARVERALEARSRELEEAGFDPQVPVVGGLSLVFATRNGVRERLPLGAAGEQVAAAPEVELGPNVLLRPIVERTILPTASYVAGPGEISYFAQLSAVADALGVPVPTVVPRWSGTILEPHIERILDRYGLSVEDLRDPHAAESRLARERVSTRVREALRDAREGALGPVQALRRALGGPAGDDALVPPAVIDGLERDIAHRLARLERRIVAGAKRRHADVMRDVATARGALYPAGKPQERALNFMPLLARHGPPLLEQMLERAREHAAALTLAGAPSGFRHQELELRAAPLPHTGSPGD